MTIKILYGLAAAACISTASVHAQDDDFSLNLGQAEQAGYYTKIPYRNVNGKIVIEVLLNGKIRKFIVDTSAPLTISEDLFDESKFSVLRNVNIRDANGVKDSVKVASVSGISIGGVVFNNIPAVVKKTALLSCMGVDGLIGSNLLRNSIIQFNSPEKTIILTDSYSENPNLSRGLSTQMELDPQQSLPIITVYPSNEEKMASHVLLFDTGDDNLYTVSIRNYKFFEENIAGLFDKYAEAEGAYALSLNETTFGQQHYLLRVPGLSVNGICLKNVMAYTTHDENSRIGSPILDHGTVTLDYIDKTFIFSPVVSVSSRIWTISPMLKDGKLVVGAIWDKSLQDKVNVGDKILKIADIDYTSFDTCDFFTGSMPKNANVDTVTIVLEDINTREQKSVEISLIK
jgi:hypothetical protein